MTRPKYIPVGDIMRKDITFVDGLTDVFEALLIMKRVQATCLIVNKRHETDEYGMVLFSDIAKQVIARDRAPERVSVYEIMAKPVISVQPDMDIRYCARLFDNFGISHAPVIDGGEVVGIVSYYLLAMGALPSLD